MDTKKLIAVINEDSNATYMALVSKNNHEYLYELFPINPLGSFFIMPKDRKLKGDIIRKPNMTEFFNAAQTLKIHKKLFNLKTKKWIQK